jgi:hypothetical protein
MVTARTVKVYRIGTAIRPTAAVLGDVRDLGVLLDRAAETPHLQPTGRWDESWPAGSGWHTDRTPQRSVRSAGIGSARHWQCPTREDPSDF